MGQTLHGLDRLNPQQRQALRARIDYLRDLGIFDLYHRESDATGLVTSLEASGTDTPDARSNSGADPRPAPDAVLATLAGASVAGPGAAVQSLFNPAPLDLPPRPDPHSDSHIDPYFDPYFDKDPAIAPRNATLLPIAFTPGPLIAPEARAQVLEALRLEIGDCTRCPLGFAGRNTIVFGDGDPNARLLFVGEGPGADEDRQGIPFVGRAGQLLNNMITAMGLAREQVYIANIVKCRPPKNRVPEPIEATTCSQFLLRQIDIVRPQVIVALGATAATYLLGGKSPLAALRGRIHPAHGARLIVTYHPAYLLRDPTQKKAAWTDLQLAMAELKAGR
jgi:DNA polymerase